MSKQRSLIRKGQVVTGITADEFVQIVCYFKQRKNKRFHPCDNPKTYSGSRYVNNMMSQTCSQCQWIRHKHTTMRIRPTILLRVVAQGYTWLGAGSLRPAQQLVLKAAYDRAFQIKYLLEHMPFDMAAIVVALTK